ncbi:CapA family protein [Mycobacterium sp. B14F4]|uniref:CapA family protein n=1 Tax=Mycobacterium sp. B14F4 TaxID=3153565 RepID=UPI00325CECC1
MAGDGHVVTLLLGGDVMLGRGVDQILPHPGDPELRESYMRDARGYVGLAERANGPITRPVDWSWPWGELLTVVADAAPDVRLINLETTITTGEDFAEHKPVCYRMNPDNLPALTAFRPDVCTLANNHILDFGRRGLSDTVAACAGAGIQGVGAGSDTTAARRLAAVTVRGHRVLVASVAMPSSGVPATWAAQQDRSGVWWLRDSSRRSADELAALVLERTDGGDIVVVSVHWGSNWGYGIEPSDIAFAHRLVDAGVDVVHGHSSHHPRPLEIYRGRTILYGCGDVIDDYEGIGGHRSFRSELRLLYLVSVDPGSGETVALQLIPARVRRMRLERASSDDTEWLRATAEHTSRHFHTQVAVGHDGLLEVTSR